MENFGRTKEVLKTRVTIPEGVEVKEMADGSVMVGFVLPHAGSRDCYILSPIQAHELFQALLTWHARRSRE